jgi:16S rRNA (cytidine1402-2'-O)-methyltransferase
MANPFGNLYLIPVPIHEGEASFSIPKGVIERVKHLNHVVVENEKTARKMIRCIYPEVSQPALTLSILDKNTPITEIESLLSPCQKGIPVGLMSEAGVPAVADPGSRLVEVAHQKNIKVIPLVGPSSILLALMASGLNGQSFAFNGYLPIDSNDKKRTVLELEKRSFSFGQTQIFMETPYRNDKMFEFLVKILGNETLLSVAVEINGDQEYIKTLPVSRWKTITSPDLHKRPAIFSILKK